MHICDQICKKGSYTCTTSVHMQILPPLDSNIIEQAMHVCISLPTVHQSAFPKAGFWGMSDIHKCSDCL